MLVTIIDSIRITHIGIVWYAYSEDLPKHGHPKNVLWKQGTVVPLLVF